MSGLRAWRVTGIMACAIVLLGLSAIPASAQFKSTAKPAQVQGGVKVLKEGKFEDQGVPIKCVKEEIKAQYQILGEGQIKQQLTPTTTGQQLQVQVKSWGKCTATVLSIKVPAEITPCAFRMMGTDFGVATSCLIKIAVGEEKCEVQIPAGMERESVTQHGINVGLEQGKFGNSGKNALAALNITAGGEGQLTGEGIFVIGSKGKACPTTNEEGTLKEFELELEEMNASIDEFESEKTGNFSGELTGVNEAVFEFEANSGGGNKRAFKCKEWKLSGTVVGVQPTIIEDLASPVAEKCETETGVKIKVLVEDCGYEQLLPAPAGAVLIGNINIVGTNNLRCKFVFKKMEEEAGCQATIKSGTGPYAEVEYKNSVGGGTPELEQTYRVSGIKYESAGICLGLLALGESTAGKFKAITKVAPLRVN